MSNTYYEIDKTIEYKDSYTDKMHLSLNAYVGENLTKGLQITITTDCSLHLIDSGTAYIRLNEQEALELAEAIKERFYGGITATGDEQSKFMKNEETNMG